VTALPQPGHEGPTPVQHRCRTCRQPVETYRATGTRMLLAKPHDRSRPNRQVCIGSFGPVDADADVLAEVRPT
jgi:hypothetical protein